MAYCSRAGWRVLSIGRAEAASIEISARASPLHKCSTRTLTDGATRSRLLPSAGAAQSVSPRHFGWTLLRARPLHGSSLAANLYQTPQDPAPARPAPAPKTANSRDPSSSVAKSKPRDDVIPFLGSRARKFTVDEELSANPDRGRFAIPLGFSLFAIVIYFGFIRPYDEGDRAVVDFLTSDISAKLPEGVQVNLQELGVVVPEASPKQEHVNSETK